MEYGNVGTGFSYVAREGFGWMNASFEVRLVSDAATRVASTCNEWRCMYIRSVCTAALSTIIDYIILVLQPVPEEF